MINTAYLKRRKKKRIVFSRNRNRAVYSIRRQLIVSILMYILALIIFKYVNEIPNRRLWVEGLGDLFIRLIKGLSESLSAAASILAGLLVICGMIIGIVLIFGATIRFIRVIALIKSKNHI